MPSNVKKSPSVYTDFGNDVKYDIMLYHILNVPGIASEVVDTILVYSLICWLCSAIVMVTQTLQILY